jgi:hypothetical protein
MMKNCACGNLSPSIAMKGIVPPSPNNVIFRIPTPTFGAGLIEQMSDAAIMANQASDASLKQRLGMLGRPNFQLAGNTITGMTNQNGNDGTIARFGWKAQNKSLLLFSGEAYNVEMGITNELFQTERDESANGQFAPVPKHRARVVKLDAHLRLAHGDAHHGALIRFHRSEEVLACKENESKRRGRR